MKLTPEFARIVFWLAVASCAVAQVGIILSTWRALAARTNSPDAGAAAGVRIRRAPELAWAVLPAFALVLVFAGTWHAMHQYSDAGNAPIHRHPPATVTGEPTRLATRSSPPKKGVRSIPALAVRQPNSDQPRADVVDVTEVPQR